MKQISKKDFYDQQLLYLFNEIENRIIKGYDVENWKDWYDRYQTFNRNGCISLNFDREFIKDLQTKVLYRIKRKYNLPTNSVENHYNNEFTNSIAKQYFLYYSNFFILIINIILFIKLYETLY